MKIQIKTLKSKKYELEVKADETVQEIKEKIQKELDLGDATMMSLIHHGKILKNEQTAENAGFKENDFVVLMVKKKKRKRKNKTRETTQATVNATAATEQPSEAKTSASQTTANSAVATTENPAAAESNAPSGANAFVMGNQLNEAVQNLVSMGFPEADVQRAMRAAFNNPERAAEYLLSGIPQNIGAPPAQAAVNRPPASQVAAAQPAAVNNPLAAAGLPPQNMIRQLMAQNPQSMAAILQHIMRNQPELFRGIGADGNIDQAAIENLLRDENFMQMMMQAMAGGAQPGMGAAQGPGVGAVGPGLGVGSGMMGQHGAQRPPVGNQNVIRMTHAEAESIERLKNIGFSQHQALEAFLVCNKNEQMAANYLFENAGDFHGNRVAAPVAAAAQPVNPAPQVAPPVQPVVAEEQPAVVQANDAQAEAPPADEANANEGPANQQEVIANAQRAEGDEAKNNDNADGAAADAKDQEMEDPNK